jgi:hypothetical protein
MFVLTRRHVAVTCIRRLRISSVKSHDDNEPRDMRFADKVAKLKKGGSAASFNTKLNSVDFLIEGQEEIKTENETEFDFSWNPNSTPRHKNFKKVFGDGLRAAHFGEKPTGEWAIPDHPKDVKRDYLFEDVFQRNKWLREYRLHEGMYDEQRFANFPIVIGTVHRRIAHDRVEVVVQEKDFLDVVTEFKTVNGLV